MKADTAAEGEEAEKLRNEAEEARKNLEEERARYEGQIKALKEAQENTENEELKRLEVEKAVSAGRIRELEQEVEEYKKAQYNIQAHVEKSQEEKDFARHFENCKAEFVQLVELASSMQGDKQDKCRVVLRKMLEAMMVGLDAE